MAGIKVEVKNLFNKNKNKVFYAFADGVSVDLSEVNDEMFSQKMMGEGIAIKPSEGKIYSPCDGTIVAVMKESRHAVGIRTKDGVEFLIHVGMNIISTKIILKINRIPHYPQIKHSYIAQQFNLIVLETT
ncbi:PTS glucose transporter subunit IIA [Clostridium sp.]|uniref:PTS sugar transporter subunit IIA n=1 Tax=Clostridium sp. TaxID=1506 RepID=UPI002609FF0A|nr:PTS glucose transporter subunit IIA [Clostridium sp.]